MNFIVSGVEYYYVMYVYKEFKIEVKVHCFSDHLSNGNNFIYSLYTIIGSFFL